MPEKSQINKYSELCFGCHRCDTTEFRACKYIRGKVALLLLYNMKKGPVCFVFIHSLPFALLENWAKERCGVDSSIGKVTSC